VVKSFAGAFLSAAMIALVGPASASAGGADGPSARVVAANRCNSRTISDYQGQIRNYEAHPPRSNPVDLNARLGDIADVLASLNEEHGVLDSFCATDADKAALFAQLNATVAWALVLQSDIAVKLNASCPPAAKALPAAMLAQAWLALAATVNDAGGTVPKSVAEIVPKVETRAAAIGLALPTYPETSAYWRDQIVDQARQAVAVCPTPVPVPATPTPSPYPSPPSNK
jgi:hypothetical protein